MIISQKAMIWKVPSVSNQFTFYALTHYAPDVEDGTSALGFRLQ
jgi:hypothetical protein